MVNWLWLRLLIKVLRVDFGWGEVPIYFVPGFCGQGYFVLRVVLASPSCVHNTNSGEECGEHLRA